MNRREAVLRELNLYPQWVVRGAAPVEEAVVHQTVVQQAVVESLIPSSPICQGETAQYDWPQLKASVQHCKKCGLCATRTQTVFGVGDEQANWLFVGEGPGETEDMQGEPFVGQAGKLLDNMLTAIQLKRGVNVYIANVVKCRPPGNRTPNSEEAAACFPYLQRQIELIQPKLIVALGKTAALALLRQDVALATLRGRTHDYNGIPLIVTYHPAYLLRSTKEKAKAWQDLCLAVDVMQKISAA